MELKEQIRSIAEKGLKNESFFIVEVNIARGNQVKVTILLDGDAGVNIDDCSSLSRFVSAEIEEKELIDSAFVLDVGSPGLDTPLKGKRQYCKNIGRKLKVKTLEGKTIKGTLEVADDLGVVVLLPPVKKEEPAPQRIEYVEIDWAKVQVTF